MCVGVRPVCVARVTPVTLTALTLTLVLTTGLITIFILVISVIGKWSVICARARTLSPYLTTLTSTRAPNTSQRSR